MLFRSINTYLEAGKISIPRNINNSLTLRSSVSYRITDRLSLTGFGNIGTTRFHPLQYYNFGGYVGIDITDRFGTDLGMNRYYDPFRAGWRNVPIVAPYIRINGSKFGFDFGGLIKQLYDNRSNSGYQQFDSKPASKRSGPVSPINRKSPKRPQPKNNRFRNF